MARLIHFSFCLALVLIIGSCRQSEPEQSIGRVGSVVKFAGRTWDVKSSEQPVGPGPNYFSNYYNDVWVDEYGWLHLHIAEHDGIWYSSEVVGRDTCGYGTYTFTVQADPMGFAENVVFGLFTWDDSTFFSDANSEVDIEFSKWGDTASNQPLTYSVQPVSFGAYYPERTKEVLFDLLKLSGVTTHQFKWSPEIIEWKSFAGSQATGDPLTSWNFDLNHPPRRKIEGGNTSDYVIIPKPGSHTNVRINLWCLPYQFPGPNNKTSHEVVIRAFNYTPL
jgi:hypothetical protein